MEKSQNKIQACGFSMAQYLECDVRAGRVLSTTLRKKAHRDSYPTYHWQVAIACRESMSKVLFPAVDKVLGTHRLNRYFPIEDMWRSRQCMHEDEVQKWRFGFSLFIVVVIIIVVIGLCC